MQYAFFGEAKSESLDRFAQLLGKELEQAGFNFGDGDPRALLLRRGVIHDRALFSSVLKRYGDRAAHEYHAHCTPARARWRPHPLRAPAAATSSLPCTGCSIVTRIC